MSLSNFVDHPLHPGCPSSLRCLADTNQSPPHLLSVIIHCAILGSPERELKFSDILSALKEKYSFFAQRDGPSWRNSVRKELRTNDLFVKVVKGRTFPGNRPRSYWTIDASLPCSISAHPTAGRLRSEYTAVSAITPPEVEGFEQVDTGESATPLEILHMSLTYSQTQLADLMLISTQRLKEIESYTLLSRRAYATLAVTESKANDEVQLRARAEDRLLEVRDERVETEKLITELTREESGQLSTILIKALEDIECYIYNVP